MLHLVGQFYPISARRAHDVPQTSSCVNTGFVPRACCLCQVKEYVRALCDFLEQLDHKCPVLMQTVETCQFKHKQGTSTLCTHYSWEHSDWSAWGVGGGAAGGFQCTSLKPPPSPLWPLSEFPETQPSAEERAGSVNVKRSRRWRTLLAFPQPHHGTAGAACGSNLKWLGS